MAPEPSAEAELRVAAYTAAHDWYGRPEEASAVFLLAVPHDSDGSWRLRVVTASDPTGFRIDASAFRGPSEEWQALDNAGEPGHP
ncbi:hypothetical protein ACFFHJ_05895 [Planotetraspora thailandica]|nr:hypothetical protein [Planotetraspora thailandica]